MTIGTAGGDRWRNFLTAKGRRAGVALPGVATPVPLREPVGLDTNNTLLGRKVLERGRGLAEGDQVLPGGRGMHKIAYLEKNSGGGELHGEYWQ